MHQGVAAQVRVDHGVDGADLGKGAVDHQEVLAVFHEHGHGVPFADPLGEEVVGHAVDPRVVLAVGQGALVGLDRRVFRETGCAGFQKKPPGFPVLLPDVVDVPDVLEDGRETPG
ncbi:MAG: hypothetical protein JRJ18_18290 [Deltaproteobacteria bacterium]|nr:hypothetical protein [Deltaproteobacteria bacterium]